jgi:hypothetical protein
VQDRIKEDTLESLRSAIQIYPTNARLIAHLGLKLANVAVAEKGDPAHARSALAEADYQTSRALKLDPNNDEVRKPRDKVVEMLNLPSEPKTTN